MHRQSVKKQMRAKRNIRADKKTYVEDLAMTAKVAAREGNLRELIGTTESR